MIFLRIDGKKASATEKPIGEKKDISIFVRKLQEALEVQVQRTNIDSIALQHI